MNFTVLYKQRNVADDLIKILKLQLIDVCL